jgi:hypothetical protein
MSDKLLRSFISQFPPYTGLMISGGKQSDLGSLSLERSRDEV